MEKPTFEESYETIKRELDKRRHKWTLFAVAAVDYDDVKQIILLHIWKKWEHYDPTRPLVNWVNRIISHQISNIRRNLYDSHSRPCLKCPCAEGIDLCSIYEKQCSLCPLYARWERTKKRAHDVKLPVTIENHEQEVHSIPLEFNMENISLPKIHDHMKELLKPLEWRIYQHLFIEGLSEGDAAIKMGYTTNEKYRKPGYSTITKIRKIIIAKFKAEREKGFIDIFE